VSNAVPQLRGGPVRCSEGTVGKILPLLAACCVLTGCMSLEDTAAYYTPVSATYYPPLPEKAPVPILAASPPWGHRVIGRFAMETDRGQKFVQRALAFNARRQGADAVVLRNLDFDLRRNYNYVPPSWDNVPMTSCYNQRVQNNKGNWVNVPQYYTTYMPVFRPGRVYVDDVLWTDVKADMVVRRGKKPLAVPLAEQIEVP